MASSSSCHSHSASDLTPVSSGGSTLLTQPRHSCLVHQRPPVCRLLTHSSHPGALQFTDQQHLSRKQLSPVSGQMQPGVRWFKGPSGEAFKFQCRSRGIHVPELAAEVQLKDSPLELNGVVVDFDQRDGYISLEEAADFIGELGLSVQNPIPISGQPAGPSLTGSLKDGALFVSVLFEHDHIQCTASLLVDPGCDLQLKLTEHMADQLELKPDRFAASLEMDQGHMGRVLRRGSVLTALLLQGEAEEVTKDPRCSRYLEWWTDRGTSNTSLTDGSGHFSSAGSPTSPKRSSMLQIKVLSPFVCGRDSRGHDAILGAPGVAALNLGIDQDTMRLYRKQAPKNFRKLRQQHS